jgi:hypothetical protein
VKSRVHSTIGRSITLTIIMCWISNGQPLYRERTDLHSIISSLSPSADTAHHTGTKIIFMLRFIDFGCQPCLQNFFEICDSIATIQEKSITTHVYLLFLRDQTSPGYQLSTLTRWARSSGLLYPVALVTAEVFKRYGIEHSSVLVMDNNGNVANCGEIPLSWFAFQNIVRIINK